MKVHIGWEKGLNWNVKKNNMRKKQKISPEEMEKLQKMVEALQPKLVLAGPHLLYGTPLGFQDGLDFLDANIGLIPFGIDNKELPHLERIAKAIEQGCNAKAEKPLEEIARQVMKDETGLNLSDYDMKVSAWVQEELLLQ